MNSFLKFILMYFFNTLSSFSDNWYIGSKIDCFSFFNLISWSHDWCFESVVFTSFFVNSEYSLYFFENLYFSEMCFFCIAFILCFSDFIQILLSEFELLRAIRRICRRIFSHTSICFVSFSFLLFRECKK